MSSQETKLCDKVNHLWKLSTELTLHIETYNYNQIDESELCSKEEIIEFDKVKVDLINSIKRIAKLCAIKDKQE
jgi:hypothetical protein